MGHYCKDEGGRLHWEPLSQCRLAPPETFWMICVGTVTKGVGMALVFWTILTTPAKKWLDNAVITFTVGQTCVSGALLIHKAWSMSGFDSWWHHSQCSFRA